MMQHKHWATPLHRATWKNKIAVAGLLLEHRANPNAADYRGVTPLHTCCEAWNLHVEMARLLLDHHADPTVTNSHANKPLDMARDEVKSRFGDKEGDMQARIIRQVEIVAVRLQLSEHF